MILVTGATGFIGANLCSVLEKRHLAFKALVRSPTKALERGLPAGSLVQADLLGDLSPVLGDVRAVVHLAGLVRARDARELWRVNSLGTRRLSRALARVAPNARLIHVSSLAAAGPSSSGSGTGCLPDEARPVSSYGRSKRDGELAIVDLPNPWLILRPAIVYGPWDSDVLVLLRALTRGFGFLPTAPSRYSLVHVSDLVRAIVLALETELSGHCLPIAHADPLRDEAWFRAMAEALGAKPRLARVSPVLLRLAAELGDIWAEFSGVTPLLGRDKFAELQAGSWVADPEPAVELIGFEAEVGPAEGFRQTVAWYRERGWL